MPAATARLAAPLAAALLCLWPVIAPAQTHPALESLVPLLEVYGAASGPTPGFDVAGIRCAGLYYAQESWRQAHGGRGPTQAELAASELHLTRAEIHRRDSGQSLVAAQQSTQTDALRVIALYTARYSANAERGHPWRNDPLIIGDTRYCDLLSR